MGLFDVCENLFKIESSPKSNCESLGSLWDYLMQK